jgi:hypothetical protein
MGNQQQQTTTTIRREGYYSTQYDEEFEIRKFEVEMGAFKKALNQIMPRLYLESDLINPSSIDAYFQSELSENFIKIIKHDYFIKTVDNATYYDGNKLKLLIFLLAGDKIISNTKTSYNDKVKLNYLKNT